MGWLLVAIASVAVLTPLIVWLWRDGARDFQATAEPDPAEELHDLRESVRECREDLRDLRRTLPQAKSDLSDGQPFSDSSEVPR